MQAQHSRIPLRKVQMRQTQEEEEYQRRTEECIPDENYLPLDHRKPIRQHQAARDGQNKERSRRHLAAEDGV